MVYKASGFLEFLVSAQYRTPALALVNCSQPLERQSTYNTGMLSRQFRGVTLLLPKAEVWVHSNCHTKIYKKLKAMLQRVFVIVCLSRRVGKIVCEYLISFFLNLRGFWFLCQLRPCFIAYLLKKEVFKLETISLLHPYFKW